MTTPYIVLSAILLVLFASVLYVVVAVFLSGRCDRQERRDAEVRADNDRLEREIVDALEECLAVTRGWFS